MTRIFLLVVMILGAFQLAAAQSDTKQRIEMATPKYVQNLIVVDEGGDFRIEGSVDSSDLLSKYMRCLDRNFGSPRLESMTRTGEKSRFVLRLRVAQDRSKNTISTCD